MDMQVGIVKFFKADEGYGFIKDEGETDVYFNVKHYVKPIPRISRKGVRETKTEFSVCPRYLENDSKICFIESIDIIGRRSALEWMFLEDYDKFQSEFEKAKQIYRVVGKDTEERPFVLWTGLDPGYLDFLVLSDPFLLLKMMGNTDVRYEKREIGVGTSWVPWIRG